MHAAAPPDSLGSGGATVLNRQRDRPGAGAQSICAARSFTLSETVLAPTFGEPYGNHRLDDVG
jgi:hypothetical protein